MVAQRHICSGSFLIGLGAAAALVSYFAPWSGSSTLNWLGRKVIDQVPLPGFVRLAAEQVWGLIFPGSGLWRTGVALGLWGLPVLCGLALTLLILHFWPRGRLISAITALVLGPLGIGYTFYALGVAQGAGGGLLGRALAWVMHWRPGWGFWVALIGAGLIFTGGALETIHVLRITSSRRSSEPRPHPADEHIDAGEGI